MSSKTLLVFEILEILRPKNSHKEFWGDQEPEHSTRGFLTNPQSFKFSRKLKEENLK